jgi:hypothetical protein
VTVNVVGGNATATTAVDGTANIATAVGVPVQLRFSKPGFADQFKSIELASGATDAYFEVTMQARSAALTLPDAVAGGTLNGADGSVVTIPADALVDASGNPVTGAVQINVTPVDVGTNPGAFPGLFQGLQPTGTRGLLASYGTVEFVLTKNGAPVQLAPGKKATIEIPIYTSLNIDGSDVTPGATIPLWSLDERTSTWVQEGTGTVVTNTASPSELALRAEVGHFSWWNCDQWLGGIPDGSYNPTVKCCIKDTPNGPCKENSGDICAHTGTGPTGGSNSIVAQLMAAAAPTRRIPTTAAFATGDAKIGVVLPMPADMDITLESTAYNGTYRGTTVFRGAPGVSETVTVNVFPVQGGGNNTPITLPWNQTYAMQTQGEVDTYKLDMPAGPGFEVRVSRNNSTLSGQVRVTRPGGSVVAEQAFNGVTTTAYIPEVTVATAGEYTIDVTAATGVPGGYRLEVVSFGACSSTDPLTLPASPTVSLGPNQSRCYDIALAADAVIKIDPGQASNQISGSFSLGTENGTQQLAARTYPGSTPILTGVAVAGTYRLRVSNTTQNTGTLALNITLPAAEVLTVPGSSTINDLVQFDDVRLFLVKPPVDGLFHVMVSATSVLAGAQVDPMLTSLSVGCGNCGTPVTLTTARALRATAPALPVVQVFKNGGNTLTNTIVVSTGVPTQITKDADIAGDVAATPQVYAFDGNLGDVIAFALARPEASESSASFGVFAPTGGELGGVDPVKTLAHGGVYTALVSLVSGTTTPFTFRINSVSPVEPLTLTAPVTQKSVSLPLGQVLRYGFSLDQGDLIGLRLNTPGALSVQAQFPVGDIYDGAVKTPDSGAGPFDVTTPPRFVNNSKPYTLSLRSYSTVQERASGDVTLGIVKPDPVAAALNVANTGTLALNEWTRFGYTVPAAGRYLLRVRSSGTPATLNATLWAGSAIPANYSGAMSGGWSSGTPGTDGLAALVAGDFTMTVRSTTTGADSTPFAATLVNLEAPMALTPNAAATAGTIDADGERDYFSFDGAADQAYTVRVTAAFAGTLRVRKLNANGDFTDRGFNIDVIDPTTALASGVEKSVSFAIPAQLGTGTYIVEVVADGEGTGDYSVQITSP